MKYECLDCNKMFLYAAKLTKVLDGIPDKPPEGQMFSKSLNPTGWEPKVEKSVCPFCNSLNIDEIHESPRSIESIQSVKINEADALLKQGYEVKDTYASSVTLVKYAPTETPTQAEAEAPKEEATKPKEQA